MSLQKAFLIVGKNPNALARKALEIAENNSGLLGSACFDTRWPDRLALFFGEDLNPSACFKAFQDRLFKGLLPELGSSFTGRGQISGTITLDPNPCM